MMVGEQKAGIQWFLTSPELATNAIEEWYKQVDPEHPDTRMRLLVETTIRDRRVELNLGPDSSPVKLYSLRTQPAEFFKIIEGNVAFQIPSFGPGNCHLI
jgi:hypothetical protein